MTDQPYPSIQAQGYLNELVIKCWADLQEKDISFLKSTIGKMQAKGYNMSYYSRLYSRVEQQFDLFATDTQKGEKRYDPPQ